MTSKATTVYDKQTFDFAGNPLIVCIKNDEPWFKLVDVCKFLGIKNPSSAKNQLDEDEHSLVKYGEPGFQDIMSKINGLASTLGSTEGLVSGAKLVTLINESGFYSLTLRCRLATTAGTTPHKFRKWVTGTVLPSIRKIGKFDAANNPPRQDMWHPPYSNSKEVEPYPRYMTMGDVQDVIKTVLAEQEPTLMKLLNKLTPEVTSKIKTSVAEQVANAVIDTETCVDDVAKSAARTKKLGLRVKKLSAPIPAKVADLANDLNQTVTMTRSNLDVCLKLAVDFGKLQSANSHLRLRINVLTEKHETFKTEVDALMQGYRTELATIKTELKKLTTKPKVKKFASPNVVDINSKRKPSKP